MYTVVTVELAFYFCVALYSVSTYCVLKCTHAYLLCMYCKYYPVTCALLYICAVGHCLSQKTLQERTSQLQKLGKRSQPKKVNRITNRSVGIITRKHICVHIQYLHTHILYTYMHTYVNSVCIYIHNISIMCFYSLLCVLVLARTADKDEEAPLIRSSKNSQKSNVSKEGESQQPVDK